MEAKDGIVGFDFLGVYDDIKTHELIIYTMEDGRKVTIHFKENNNQITITEIFEAETENTLALQKNGWQAILDNFKKYIENL